MKTVALHLGVHKTASTHIQSRLLNSRQKLKKSGIGYVPLRRLRKILTAQLNKDTFSARQVLDGLKSDLGCDRLILSDENILGQSSRPVGNRIYPQAQARVAKVLEIFAGYEIEIYVTLRSYPAYFTSRYAEAMRHFPYCTFGEFYRDVDFASVTWKDLLGTLIAAGARSVTVSDYERIFDNEQAYCNLLLGGTGIALEEASAGPEVRRSKFSAEAYAVIHSFAQHYPASTVKQMVRLLDTIPQKTPKTAFMPFSETERNSLKDRYTAEMDALRAGADARFSVRSG